MKRKINEWISIHIVKNPGRVLLLAILLFNVIFFFFSALIISNLSLSGTEKMSFFKAAFCTITMILDPGCVQFVVEDIGAMGVVVAVTCLCIIFIGMISFTGAVIGYITNGISNFIDNANAGSRELHVSDHVVVLNWNTRASEIINDLLYCEKKQKVVVLVNSRKAEIEREIEERIADTVERENRAIIQKYSEYGFLKRNFKIMFNRFRKNITVIVREGDVFSSKQLHDISVEKAKIVIILGNDINNTVCKFEHQNHVSFTNKGNSQTVKTLMQVADITSAEYSSDDQRIVVEITDDWTRDLVNRIIDCKQIEEKCNIIPVEINKILGQILAQFSLMPELNYVYKELLSNKGATFYTEESTTIPDTKFIPKYLEHHKKAIPLTHMITDDGKSYAYYVSDLENDIKYTCENSEYDYKVDLNNDYWIEQKNVIILGHNSRCRDIMEAFCNFRSEWNKNDGSEILHITVIDNQENLDKMNNYEEYPFVLDTIPASIYDRELICSTIDRIVSKNCDDTSILILSDDKALNDDIDANALANLVFVQDIINTKIKNDPDFDKESIDVIVEIIDPKHHDIVNSYSVNNVVISNRYISKMVTQIGEKEALFEFYKDILTYDIDTTGGYESKEVYVKKVSSFFDKIPKPCKADEFIRAVYNASVSKNLPENKRFPTVALGYVKPGGNTVLFAGNQSEIDVNISKHDKLIVYSNH
ncbi:MAG TPA: hypothetical protein OIM34_08660 [Ruminococcus bromii]|nr:hypothetical protein [Ruminococcus bromii]